jgi:hypothetical protein
VSFASGDEPLVGSDEHELRILAHTDAHTDAHTPMLLQLQEHERGRVGAMAYAFPPGQSLPPSESRTWTLLQLQERRRSGFG